MFEQNPFTDDLEFTSEDASFHTVLTTETDWESVDDLFNEEDWF